MDFTKLNGKLFILLVGAACTLHARETTQNWAERKPVTFPQLQRHFAEPDMMYGPFAFWFWDEPLNADKAAVMAQKMAKQRLNPGYAHARMNQAGMEDLPRSQWLSPTWFEAFGRVLHAAQESQCYFGYVDEYWWPSGRAAGRVLEDNPELWAVSLKWETLDVAPGARVELPESFFTVAAQLAKEAGTELPKTEAGLRPHNPAVIHGNTLQIIGKGRPLAWEVPDNGPWRVYSFSQYYHPGADGGRLNYIDDRVSQAFIKLAHEPYEKHFCQQMGQAIPGVFVDNEGDYGYKLAWSDTLQRRYRRQWGVDIRRTLPLMIDQDSEGVYAKVRFQWFDTVSDLYSEYLGATSTWLAERGMYCISNLWEETLMWQAGAVGDFFKTQRAYSMPGTDCLALNALKIHDFKETQSVTEFENRRMQSEIMGAAGFWGFSPVTIKQVANAITTWGVSHVVPHGIFMTRKLSGNPWLPDWYEQNPMWPYLHLWTDFVRRASYINSHGHTVPDVLLVNPMDSVWVLSGPGAFDPAHEGRVPVPPVMPLPTEDSIEQSREQLKRNSAWWCPPTMDSWFCDDVKQINEVYSQTMLDLAAGRIEYLIADRHYFQKMTVEDALLVCGSFRFKTVVIPPVTVLPLDVANRIVAFARTGGHVYALGSLPTGSTDHGMNDSRMQALMKRLRACQTFRACADSLKDEIDCGAPGLVSRIGFRSGRFEMLQQHRRIDQRDFFWLANNTGKAQACTLSLDRIPGAAAIWNCETGEVLPVATQIEGGQSVLDLKFDPYEAFWLVLDPQGKHVLRVDPEQPFATLAQLAGHWHVQVDLAIQPPLEHEPGIPEAMLEGIETPLQDWKAWDLKRFSGYVDYTQTIDLDGYQGDVTLDLGRVRHLAQVWVNDIGVGSRLWPPFEFDVTDQLKTGANTIRVRVGNLTNNNYGQSAESGLFGPVVLKAKETDP